MTFKSKLRHALALFESGQVKSRHYQPIIYRLLWALGIEVTPPHFTSFAQNWIFLGLITGFPWSAMMLAGFRFIGVPWAIILPPLIPVGIAVGTVAGYMAARNIRRESEQSKLPLWKDFHPVD